MKIYETIYEYIQSEKECKEKILILGNMSSFLSKSLEFIDEIALSEKGTIEMSYYELEKLIYIEFKDKINIQEAYRVLMKYRNSLIHESIKIKKQNSEQ